MFPPPSSLFFRVAMILEDFSIPARCEILKMICDYWICTRKMINVFVMICVGNFRSQFLAFRDLDCYSDLTLDIFSFNYENFF